MNIDNPPDTVHTDPNSLLDALLERLRLKNDAALARALGVAPPVLSKIRHRKLAVKASMLLRMHEHSGLSIAELRQLMEGRREPLSLPAWFQPAFGHLRQNDYDTAVRLWRKEPALRRLTASLEALLPDRRQLDACIRCNHTAIKSSRENKYGIKQYACSACGAEFIAAQGTPFHALQISSYPRVFATAVTLWGPWTPFVAWQIAGASDHKVFARYVRRIRPLLDALAPDPLVSRPAYRFGFTPAQQGMRCLRCDSTELTYVDRYDPDNPRIRCTGCHYKFRPHAAYRRLLPLPDDVRCPRCGGDHLVRQRSEAANKGPAIYRCKDCVRTFTATPKTPSAKDGTQPLPVSAASYAPSGGDTAMNLDAAGESAAMLVSTGRNTDHLPGSGHGDPNMLLDALRDRMKVKNDAALCRALGVPPPVISKIRHRRLPVGVTILVRMHEKSGLSIQELQRLLGNGENK